MDKCVSFYVTLFMMSVVIATVTSFGGNGGGLKMGGGFGGDVFNRKYQTWLEKRGGGMGGQGYGGFGSPLGSENRYFNWKDYLAGVSKRQLNYGPRNFGNFQSALSRYFTDGLQDWRSTYTGGVIKKREVGTGGNQEDTPAAAAADSEA